MVDSEVDGGLGSRLSCTDLTDWLRADISSALRTVLRADLRAGLGTKLWTDLGLVWA